MPDHIYLHADKQDKIIQAHPWVFPKAIAKYPKDLAAGTWVKVLTQNQSFIGAGFYNPHSLYRVRILSYQDVSAHQAIEQNLSHAFRLRHNLNLPNKDNTAYRLCNSEADGLSGLVIDVFNHIMVVSASSYWVEQEKVFIQACLNKQFPKHRILWIPQKKALSQDGLNDVEAAVFPDIECTVLENGISLAIHFSNVQKTGIFIDQRENHQRLGALCRNKRVLDLYTYHGGFALNAAKAGASAVLAVDSSAAAIEHAKRNAALNQFSQIEFEQGDAKNYLKQAQDYDVIILDPPKLVPSKKHLHQAKNLYRYLHRELFKHIKPGSFLMTCNCSSALRPQEFLDLVARQAAAEHKQIQVLGHYGPAICHPIKPSFPEGNYLSAILISII